MGGKTRLDGLVMPRDYGISLRVKDGGKLFVSPVKYAIGNMMLETPFQLGLRIKEKAEREGIDFEELKGDFAKGLRRRGCDVSKSFSDVVSSVKRYNDTVTANVISRDGDDVHDVVLNNPSLTSRGNFVYGGARCDCSDSHWGEPKKREIMCSHLAALEIALYKDSNSRLSAENNLTGLAPSQRFERASMPFNLFGVGSERRVDSVSGQILTDMLVDYFASGKSMFEIDKQVLDRPEVYTVALVGAIKSESDGAQFNVLRQGVSKSGKLRKTDREYSGALKAMFGRVEKVLGDAGFERSGYGLDFKGTGFETVGKRFRRGNIVYSLGVSEECPVPLVLKKTLDEKLGAVLDGDDSRVDFPLCRVGQEYRSVDDATRRTSYDHVIVPWENGDRSVFAARILKDRYDSMKVGA